MPGLREIRVVDGSRRHKQPPLRQKRKGKLISYRVILFIFLVVGCLVVALLNISSISDTRTNADMRKTAVQEKDDKAEQIILETLEPEPDTSNSEEDAEEETKAPKKKHHSHKHNHEETPEPELDESSAGESSDAEKEVFSSLEEHLRSSVIPDCNCHSLTKDQICLCEGPDEVDDDYKDLKKLTGCDMFTVPFDPASDTKCIETIGNQASWTDLKPMKQEYDERTIKFKAHFPDKRLRAIVKVPQKLFPHEAVSEVGSYHADRVMNLNRVPPTVWTYIPVERVLEMVNKYGDEMKLIDIFAKDSKVDNYKEWIKKDFLDYARKRSLITQNHPDFPDTEVVGVSVQLFVAEVRPLLSSSLAIPWVPHNDSWQRHLSPSHPFKVKHAVGFVRQSELAMFDYVLGNGDRSPNKNNFVVGACRHHTHVSKCGSGPKHPGPPSFITLDNGLMFLYDLVPGRSPDGPNPLLKDTFCIFEKKLLARLRELNDEVFSKVMQEILPKRLQKFITLKMLHKCDHRLHKLLRQVDKCVEEFGEEKVIMS
eukprot:TRINITY_DN8837_c0_g1_i1.p1 TRINITY_DN8837_c0_g1~~TRINITY_DN8837_c0_g1_i1.p1  ORF type:complete len:539 (+),score=110.74 TRINITY_DN8837_c0_g1_i1:114-1730(+)